MGDTILKNCHSTVDDLSDSVLELFLKKLRNELGSHIKYVFLYGSRARGDNYTDSDYDCMVVVDALSSSINDTIDEITGEFLYEYDIIFSVFIVSIERYTKQTYNPLFINVKNEGIEL